MAPNDISAEHRLTNVLLKRYIGILTIYQKPWRFVILGSENLSNCTVTVYAFDSAMLSCTLHNSTTGCKEGLAAPTLLFFYYHYFYFYFYSQLIVIRFVFRCKSFEFKSSGGRQGKCALKNANTLHNKLVDCNSDFFELTKLTKSAGSRMSAVFATCSVLVALFSHLFLTE